MADSAPASSFSGRVLSRTLSVAGALIERLQASLNDKNGFGRRWLLGLPFIVLAMIAPHLMDTRPALPFAKVIVGGGEIVWGEGRYRVPILSSFYGSHGLDEVITIANMFFMPAVYGYDAASRSQAISFLSDGGIIIAVWCLESMRKGEKPWYLQHPTAVALLGQLLGLGVLCPLYCFLSLTYSPTPQADSLPSSPSSPASLTPALLLGYYIPTYAMLFWPNLPDRQTWLFIWQLYPVYVSLLRHLLSLVPQRKPKQKSISRGSSPTRSAPATAISVPDQLARNLLFTRICMATTTFLSAAAWQFTIWTNAANANANANANSKGDGSGTLAGIFLPSSLSPAGDALPDFGKFSAQFLRFDELFVLGPMLLWLGYVYGQAKRQHVIKVSWINLLGMGVMALIGMGPGATLALGWMYREEILAEMREKEALRLEVVAKVEFLLKENGA